MRKEKASVCPGRNDRWVLVATRSVWLGDRAARKKKVKYKKRVGALRSHLQQAGGNDRWVLVAK